MAHYYSDDYLSGASKGTLAQVAKDKNTDQATRDKANAILAQKSGGTSSGGKTSSGATGGSKSSAPGRLVPAGSASKPSGSSSKTSGSGAKTSVNTGTKTSRESSGGVNLNAMSNEQLEARASSNSKLWHTDPAKRSQYEAENKAIKSLLDQRNGTKSTLDTTTGKWTTTGGGGATGGSSGSSQYSSKYTGGIAALDRQLALYSQRYKDARERAMAGDVDAVREMREANDSANQLRNQYGFAAEFANDDIAYIQRQAEAMRGNVRQGTLPMEGWTGTQWPESPLESDYDLSEYLKRQKAAQLESALAGLKGAYEQSLAGYLSAGERLGEYYDTSRNSAAAQDAIARRIFQEQAAASGLGSGAAGQAELARSAALTGELARIGQAQAGAEADLDLQKKNLQSQYETAIAQARQSGDSEMATALYQELVRIQGLERQDKQLEESRAQAAEQLAYNRAQTAKQEAQSRVGAYLSTMGTLEGLDPALVQQSGYTQGELTALADYYANLMASQSVQKPTLTAAQVNDAIKNGILSSNVLSAYEYYYGVPYGGRGGAAMTTYTGGGETPTKTQKAAPAADQGGAGAVLDMAGPNTPLSGGPGNVAGAADLISSNGILTPKGMAMLLLGANSEAVPNGGDGGIVTAEGYTQVVRDLTEARQVGATDQDLNAIIVGASTNGIITGNQALELRRQFVGAGR